MYTLYYNKRERQIQVQKASKSLNNLNYTEEVQRHNDCYLYCKKRKPLVEKAKELQAKWISEVEQEFQSQLQSLKEMKF